MDFVDGSGELLALLEVIILGLLWLVVKLMLSSYPLYEAEAQIDGTDEEWLVVSRVVLLVKDGSAINFLWPPLP